MHEQSAWLLFETRRRGKFASRYVFGGTSSTSYFCSCRVCLYAASSSPGDCTTKAFPLFSKLSTAKRGAPARLAASTSRVTSKQILRSFLERVKVVLCWGTRRNPFLSFSPTPFSFFCFLFFLKLNQKDFRLDSRSRGGECCKATVKASAVKHGR